MRGCDGSPLCKVSVTMSVARGAKENGSSHWLSGIEAIVVRVGSVCVIDHLVPVVAVFLPDE